MSWIAAHDRLSRENLAHPLQLAMGKNKINEKARTPWNLGRLGDHKKYVMP
jgi:hypothetical protein